MVYINVRTLNSFVANTYIFIILKTSGRSMVINVEYNQLDPLLRATGFPDGDVNCETGYSPFPGNINQVIFWHRFSFSSHLSPFWFLFCFPFKKCLSMVF